MPPDKKDNNPAEKKFNNDYFSNLNKSEKKGTVGSGVKNSESGIDGVKNAEESSGGDWKNKVEGLATSKVGGGRFNFLKKKSAGVAITLSLIGFALVGIGGVAGPSLVIVQFKEVMTEKFNNQFPSMDVRSTKLLSQKMHTLSGICTSVVSIKCKYSTMSEKQIKNFEKAGIKVEFDPKEPKSLMGIGRRKPKGFTFENKTILAKGFNAEINSNPKFRSAVKLAYNPKFAGFSDSIWKKVATKLKISKKAPDLDADTDEDKLKKVQEATKSGVDVTDDISEVKPGDKDPDTGEVYDEDTAAAKNKSLAAASDVAGDVADNADDIAEKGVKSAPAALEGATKASLNLGKITGVMDNACLAYNTMRAVGYAAKTVRAAQLARYAMLFLVVADQIKAGDAKPEDVAYLGGIMTAEFISTSNGIKSRKTATDSFGYRYAAYGDKGNLSDTAAQFLAGGGLTGKLIKTSEIIDESLGGNPKKMCKILANPFVGAGSAAVGIGSLFVPGAAPVAWARLAKDAAISAGIMIAISYIPTLLQDIVAGVLVDKTTVGEAAGDAITSGSSGMMGATANAGGNAPLTPKQAVAYNNLSNEIIAQYEEEDQLTRDQLDISDKGTFLGRIVFDLTPYLSKMSSLTGALSSITSISTSSLSNLVSPNAKAASTEDDYEMCTDADYKDLGLATDPYCNVVYGIPPEYLDEDPIKVADALLKAGEINEEGEIVGSKFTSFVADCIDRDRPLGDRGKDGDLDEGKKCKIDKDNKNYYLYYVDKRVQDGMDADPEAASGGGAADPGDSSQPANTEKANKGWTLKKNVDYSATACAEGTKDEGTYKHPTNKFTIRKCSTPIGIVASIISQRAINMIKAAKSDGVDLTGSGWRSYEWQQNKYNECAPNCGGMVAAPGNSNHERGLASDLDGTGGGSGKTWDWLVKNASKYGYINYWRESWHWSMNGG